MKKADQTQEIAPPPIINPAGREPTTVEIIAALSRDSSANVDKFAQLLALKEREDAKEARAEFTQAFSRLQKKLPRVTKDGKIKLVKEGVDKGTLRFATFENLAATCNPLLFEEGFAVSFASKPSPQKGVLMICTLSHAQGHERTSEMELPPDTGAGRNALQALGSSRSYAKRYLYTDILNIIVEGQDNDASSAYPLNDEELDQVERLVLACEFAPKRLADFKTYMKVSKLKDIQRGDFQKAIVALQGVLAKREQERK